ncbi:cytochrome P450 4g15-like [Planococcus citri]|uniref:cytochrome P450 4g15-like n=1 Tax=Planococcus citri TaxID=170843 RepID=UPI0031FA2497
MKDWLGIGILNAKPEEWKKSRRVLAPAFSSDMLSKYVKKFDKTASNLVEKFRPAANSGEEIDVLLQIKNSNLEAIVEAALGVSIQSCGKEGENFCNSVMEAMKEGAVRIQYPWLIPHHIYTIYLKWTGKTKDIEHLRYLPTKILREKMDNIRNSLGADNDSTDNANSSKTIIDLLISKSSTELGFNEIRIRDELLLMIASGAETTALTISFAMLMFAIHQDIQQKAYEEIQQLTTADYDELTEDHWTDHLKYLEQCIKETMRMFSPVMVTSRRTYKEIILKDNTIVPANMFVATFIHLANYDSELYKNPEKFDPQNFSDQAIKERPNCSQLNFGYGPRSCIGFKYAMMSIKAQLTYILRSYHLSSSIKQFTKENLKTDLSIRSRIGYPIKFTSR